MMPGESETFLTPAAPNPPASALAEQNVSRSGTAEISLDHAGVPELAHGADGIIMAEITNWPLR